MANNKTTAAELMAKLANDSDYQRKIREKENARAAKEALLREEEKGLVRALQSSGVDVVVNVIPGQEYSGPPRSISDLVNTQSSYKNAIPILIKHLQMDYSRSIRAAIVRALCTPESQSHASILIQEFAKEEDPESELKWLIGAAIVEAAVSCDAEAIIDLANDLSHGQGREFLPLALVHVDKAKALPILESWIKDPVLCASAKKAIERLG